MAVLMSLALLLPTPSAARSNSMKENKLTEAT